MKRQFLYRQSGFTLFELMLVIAILSIFIAATTSFDWKPRTNAEKADLLSVSIASRLRTEIQNVAIGKMPQRNGNTLKYTELTIGNGGMSIVYKTGATASTSIGGSTFLAPFFDGDPKYEIQYVSWTGASVSGDTIASDTGVLLISTSGLSFSGGVSHPNIDKNIYLEIKAKYGSSTRKITIDKRTGQITEKKF